MMSAEITEIVEWLVAVGYPFNWSAPDHPLPEPLRRPLAEAWRRAPAPLGDPTVTVDDWMSTLEAEGAW